MFLKTAHAESTKLYYLPSRHTNINSVQDGAATYFAKMMMMMMIIIIIIIIIRKL
jgi:hypothetical protein